MAKGNRGGKRTGSSGSASNGFNGKEHAVEVKFDDGTTLLYRIKGISYISVTIYKTPPFLNSNRNGGIIISS